MVVDVFMLFVRRGMRNGCKRRWEYFYYTVDIVADVYKLYIERDIRNEFGK